MLDKAKAVLHPMGLLLKCSIFSWYNLGVPCNGNLLNGIPDVSMIVVMDGQSLKLNQTVPSLIEEVMVECPHLLEALTLDLWDQYSRGNQEG